MRDGDIVEVVRLLEAEKRRWSRPAVARTAASGSAGAESAAAESAGPEPAGGEPAGPVPAGREYESVKPAVPEPAGRPSPFRTLVACVISLRTKDQVTAGASARLFALADDPVSMSELEPEQVERAIYPAGFYRVKARSIVDISRIIVERHGGRVPDRLETLLGLPGVGRKTANLVVTKGFGKPGICVDTHVHRICNRLGYVQTPAPEKTELALREKLPGEYWMGLNELLVSFGQHLCTPVSPFCSRCPVAGFCARHGVARSR